LLIIFLTGFLAGIFGKRKAINDLKKIHARYHPSENIKRQRLPDFKKNAAKENKGGLSLFL